MAKPEKGNALKTKHSELVLETFFNEFILAWYREKTVSAQTYCKAKDEIEFLKRKKKKEKGDELPDTVDEDIHAVKGLPNRGPSANTRKPPSESKAKSSLPDANVNPKRRALNNRDKSSEEMKDLLNQKETELQQVLRKNHELKKKLSETKSTLQNTIAEADVQLNDKDQQLGQLKQNLRYAHSHVDELKKRLSKLTGDKLRDRNLDNEWSDTSEKNAGDNEKGKDISANKRRTPSEPKAKASVQDANVNPQRLAKSKDKKFEEMNQKETELQRVLWEKHELKKKLSETESMLYNTRAEADVQLNNKNQQLQQLKQNFKNAQSHVDDLTKRLSKMAGDKLRDGNPALADLSDPNRPTELGKKFSEVYDNEWSDAFEKIAGDNEEEKVGMLHGIVTEAFNYCRQKMNDQTKIVRSILLGLEEDHMSEESQQGIPKDKTVKKANVNNLLKEFRKENAPVTARNVANDFVNNKFVNFTSGFGFSNKKLPESVRKYAVKCAELCWFMVVTDPQMALSEDEAGKQFDTNLYRPYTKSVKDLKKPVVKLYVWPALHLHVGGPLVSKGVAQPEEGEQTSQA